MTHFCCSELEGGSFGKDYAIICQSAHDVGTMAIICSLVIPHLMRDLRQLGQCATFGIIGHIYSRVKVIFTRLFCMFGRNSRFSCAHDGDEKTKETGTMKLLFTGTIDSLGRLLIPEHVRKEYGLQAEREVCGYADGDGICIKSKTQNCAICSTEVSADAKIIKEKYVCADCFSVFKHV